MANHPLSLLFYWVEIPFIHIRVGRSALFAAESAKYEHPCCAEKEASLLGLIFEEFII